MSRRLRTVLDVVVCMVVFTMPTLADDTYKGDGTGGGLIPDFPQVWNEDQRKKQGGICASAAVGDALWWLDQHGNRGLANITDPKNPNKNWRTDAEALGSQLARKIYGDKYVDGKGPPSSRGWNLGVADFIRDRGFAPGNAKNNPSVSVRLYEGVQATYKNWAALIDHDKSAVVASASWRDDKFKILKIEKKDEDGKVIATYEARHALTGAGLDSDKKTVKLVHGWEDHPGDKPPYKKPPYDKGETPFIESFNAEINQAGRFSIPQATNKDAPFFNRREELKNAERVWVDELLALVSTPAVKIQNNGKKPGQKGGKTAYSYQIENLDLGAVQQFVLDVDVPFEDDSVTSPDGWKWIRWDANQTADTINRPTYMPDPDDIDGDASTGEWSSTTKGILWYTDDPTRALNPADGPLDGFSFEADDIYPFDESGLTGGLSDGLSRYLDPTREGLITELYPAGGPVPEPSTVLLLVGAVFLRRRCPSANPHRVDTP